MVEFLSTLPPHLLDPSDGQVAEPENGKSFRPAGEWWYDPKTGYTFESNGHGHFEGIIYSREMPDGQGGTFEAKSNLWRIRERPGHPLTRCDTSDGSGIAEVYKLLNDLWKQNCEWSSQVLQELRNRGVVIVTKNSVKGSIHIDKDLEQNPKFIKLLEVRNFNKRIENEVREHYLKGLEDPRNQVPDQEKKLIETLTDRSHELQKIEHERLKEKARKNEIMTNLRARYSELKDRAQKAGLAGHRVDETLEAACRDRELKDVTLTEEILDEVEASIDIEIGTMDYQKEAAKAEQTSKEKEAEEPPKEVEVPVEFKKLIESAKTQGISEFQIKVWHKQIAGDGEPYTSGVLDHLNVRVAEWLAERAEAELNGEKFEAAEESPKTVVTAADTGAKECSGPAEAQKLPDKTFCIAFHKTGEAIWGIGASSEDAQKDAHKQYTEAKGIPPEDIFVIAYCTQALYETVQKTGGNVEWVMENSLARKPSEESSTDTKKRRGKKTEEEKAAEAAEKAQKAAERAEKKAASDAVKAEKESIQIAIEDGLKAIELTNVTNKSSGEVRQFNRVTKQWFDNQIKKKCLELERDTYLAQWQERMNELKDNDGGFDYCYLSNLADPVREQFSKQKRTKIKEDGSKEDYYRPATVVTQYCKFTRKPEPEVFCNNPQAFNQFLNSLSIAEAQAYGGAFYWEMKADKSKVESLVLDGIEIPGYMVNENPDPIGIPEMSLNIHIETTKAKASLKEPVSEEAETQKEEEAA